MIVSLQLQGQAYQVDLNQAIDISIPLVPGPNGPNCFWAPYFEAEPVRMGTFVGSTLEGGPVNFLNLRLNPHGNGTHTECVGHIAKEPYTINQSLRQHFHLAALVSIYPAQLDNGDRIITLEQIQLAADGLLKPGTKAFIIRTLPNENTKKYVHYSGSNPCYMAHEAATWLVEQGIDHLLIDLPSVDREEDQGLLLAHHAFWQYPHATRAEATITELIFVPLQVKDGNYLLNLVTGPFEIDAAPSKPLLFSLL